MLNQSLETDSNIREQLMKEWSDITNKWVNDGFYYKLFRDNWLSI